MKRYMTKLILAGGGNAEQSKLVDEFFVTLLPRKKMLFLPQAIAPEIWSFEKAYEWIRKPKVFEKIEIAMWEDLEGRKYEELEEFDAVYIMGGNTFNLLNKLRQTHFIELIRKFVESGRVVYGVSAGAILFGKDVSGALIGPEADENETGLTDLSGLNILNKHNVHCHYTSEDDTEVFKHLKQSKIPIIAIPEKSGAYVDGDSLTPLGYEPIWIFKKNEKLKLESNQEFSLKAKT